MPMPATLAKKEEHAGHVMPMPATPAKKDEHAGHETPIPAASAKKDEHAAHEAMSGEMAGMAHEMGHGAGMTMDAMVRDMRNRFLVALVFAVPIFLY